MKAIHKKRLLNVARALREIKAPNMLTMDRVSHACGAPACALGHYVARSDLQKSFRLTANGAIALRRGPLLEWFRGPRICGHLGIGIEESGELFSGDGCGNAKTAKQAIKYIERFVARKEREARK